MIQDATARGTALRILASVLDDGAPLDSLLDPLPSELKDRSFILALIYVTLRRLGQIDATLNRFLSKPLPANLPALRHILRLGAAQIFFLRTPAHAAVSETVDLASDNKLQPYRGLINGVLRNLLREENKLADEKHNLPEWLRISWEASYGNEAVERIIAMQLAEPPLDLSMKHGASPALPPHERLANGSIRLSASERVTDLPGFAEGDWWVQDVAASLPVQLLGDVRGKRVFDLCAAPGGKTAQLCDRGAIVTAVERSKPRMKRLEENMQRLGFAPELVTADVKAFHPSDKADAILLDAPCSATGTIRRNPDIAWTAAHAEIDRLAMIQTELLDHAALLLKPSGALVYATCSLEPEEGEGQIARFLVRHPEFSLSPARPQDIGGIEECITEQGYLRTLPCHLAEQGGMDGFFAARLVLTS